MISLEFAPLTLRQDPRGCPDVEIVDAAELQCDY